MIINIDFNIILNRLDHLKETWNKFKVDGRQSFLEEDIAEITLEIFQAIGQIINFKELERRYSSEEAFDIDELLSAIDDLNVDRLDQFTEILNDKVTFDPVKALKNLHDLYDGLNKFRETMDVFEVLFRVQLGADNEFINLLSCLPKDHQYLLKLKKRAEDKISLLSEDNQRDMFAQIKSELTFEITKPSNVFTKFIAYPDIVNKEFLKKVKTSDILPEVLGSDHCPIILETT